MECEILEFLYSMDANKQRGDRMVTASGMVFEFDRNT